MTGADDRLDNRPFVCGVVEGFYGRPWTADQRKLLFKWMNNMGMNTYMYAPKDDYKHRAYWRDLYSVEEAENLTSLIEAANEENVMFVYALSPGLDIGYSSPKDLQFLKKKLDQVATFGCRAFAMLFDDIESDLSETDRSTFQSFAFAQVSVSNEVYEHLGQPNFYFCPTEYCVSRTVPNLSASEYLKTVGVKLLPGIDILWTGSNVVSKKITVQHLEDVTAVMKRPPVIWDNIHANDYDPRRVFLGPYDGRSPELIPYLRGVLTNPNCEFEANFVPFHTLSQWSKSNSDGVKKDIISGDRLSPVASDIKLETESDYGSDDDLPVRFDSRYQPRRALKTALFEWYQQFATRRQPAQIAAAVAAEIPVPTCMAVTPTTTTVPSLGLDKMSDMLNNGIMGTNVVNSSYMQPKMNPGNSLVEPKEVDPVTDIALDLEPMDCIPSPAATTNAENITKVPSTDNLMQVDSHSCDNASELDNKDSNLFSLEDLYLLVDLFYLPFEHGSQGVQLLQDLFWLKCHAHVMQISRCKTASPQKMEWLEKAAHFQERVEKICLMAERLTKIKNRSLIHDLYPYVWDFLGVIQTCSTYIKWLGYTSGYKEAFSSGEHEPWLFRGGLQSEFQRMLPIDGAHDLFLIKPPECVIMKFYKYRPYSIADQDMMFDLCLKTCDDGMDGTDVFPEFPSLIGDRLLGGLVTISPEYSFVVEEENGMCGYVVAALDAVSFQSKLEIAWLPDMCNKYPKPGKKQLSPAEEMIMSFHTAQRKVPHDVLARFPSLLRLDVLPSRIQDPAVPKRLLACALSALKNNGSIGVHTEVNIGDKYMLDFYGKLGFYQLTGPHCVSDEVIYLGRII